MTKYEPKTNTMLTQRVEFKRQDISGNAYSELMQLISKLKENRGVKNDSNR